MRTIATRLQEGQDLKQAIESLVKTMDLSAVTIVSGVGSLREAKLRMAGADAANQDIRLLKGPFEIVSLVGNLGQARSHIHMAISDKEGAVFGGHVKEGCIIHTTAELVLIVSDDLIFSEKQDPNTGFGELSIQGK